MPTVTGKGTAPFLGLSARKPAGPTIVKFRARAGIDCAGKVEWLQIPQATDKAKSVAFQLAGGGWRELAVELPATGKLGILRLYLPAEKDAVQLDWMALKPTQGKSQRWDFSHRTTPGRRRQTEHQLTQEPGATSCERHLVRRRFLGTL